MFEKVTHLEGKLNSIYVAPLNTKRCVFGILDTKGISSNRFNRMN